MHYFAEEELMRVKADELEDSGDTDGIVPFDGLSCTAFKLDHLKMGEQAKRLAAYEQSQCEKAS
jgi:hypothetical protein